MLPVIKEKEQILPHWIVVAESSGDEWTFFRKEFNLQKTPTYAEILFSSRGICGLYINGSFVESCTSRHQQGAEYIVDRYHCRVNRHEITSLLRQGQNLISLELGSSYFQNLGMDEYKRSGLWFSEVALIIKINYSDETVYIITDESWKCSRERMTGWNQINFRSDRWLNCNIVKRVNTREYYKFWETATLWQELPDNRSDFLDKPVSEFFGEEYMNNVQLVPPDHIKPSLVVSSNKAQNLNGFLKGVKSLVIGPQQEGEKSYIIFDFERLVVGYLMIEFEKTAEGFMDCEFDYSEDISDFEPEAEFCTIVKKLSISVPIQREMKDWINIRRRAFRYLKLSFSGMKQPVRISKLQIKSSMYPVINKGWFKCSDSLLNKIWSTGRYTLHVNMHQEYESCPRHEMLFFAGDGYIDALVDYYTFGDGALLTSSLSVIAPEGALGISYDTERTSALWDYFCWRIITIWQHYIYKKDKSLIDRYYNEAINAIEWLIARMDNRNLIYQLPVGDSVEWTCSYDRLGEKAFLNSLFYKSLLCMVELGDLLQDIKNAEKWNLLAVSVKEAINQYLWVDEKKAYIDNLYDYIPQDGNALAVLFGVSDKGKSKISLNTLKEKLWSPYGSVMFNVEVEHARGRVISPLMCTYEAEANFINGMDENALDLIRRCWGTMIKKGAGTFWEFAYNDEIKKWPIPAHAWSSGCTYLLPAYVLGVKPLLPGYEEVKIRPRLGNLEWAEGVVPVPQGLIGVKCWNNTELKNGLKEYFYTILIPEGIKNILVDIPYESRVEINDILIMDKGHEVRQNSISVKKIQKDTNSICITISGSGKYAICAKSCQNK